MRKTSWCLLGLSILVASAAAQGTLIMPDSTNNRVVAFNALNGSVSNNNMFALTASTTPVHAMRVNNEIWVSEQLGDKVSRWSLTGISLGSISGSMDNVRGMGQINGTIYVTSTGTGNGAPGRQVRMFDTSGAFLGNFLTPASAGFHVLSHQGGLLISSDAANDDIHRYSLAGADLGSFHNSTSLNFAEQMTYAADGNVLVAGFSSNQVVKLNVNTGAVISTFAASGARGVALLGNGNVLWTNSSGAHVYDMNLGTSSQVYAGGGRFLDRLDVVPEPASMAALAMGLAYLRTRRRQIR